MTDTQTPQIQTKTTSSRFTIDWRDLLFTAEMGGWGAAAGSVYSAIDSFTTNHVISFDWKTTLALAIGGALSAVVHKFLKPPQTIVVNPQDVVKVNTAAAGNSSSQN